MLAFQITSMKNFMHCLLNTDIFDLFLLEEAVISTANTYSIEGRVNKEFFQPEELTEGLCPYEFTPWKDIRGLCFDLIKGKRTPLSFKFVLHLKPEQAQSLLQKGNCDMEISQVKALVLTIRYDGEKAMLTTGCSYHTFVISKEPEVLWDKALSSYLAQKGIAYETL